MPFQALRKFTRPVMTAMPPVFMAAVVVAGNDNDGAAPVNMVGGRGRGGDCGVDPMEVSDDDSGDFGGDFGGDESSDGDVDDNESSTASTSSSTGPMVSASSPVDAAASSIDYRDVSSRLEIVHERWLGCVCVRVCVFFT